MMLESHHKANLNTEHRALLFHHLSYPGLHASHLTTPKLKTVWNWIWSEHPNRERYARLAHQALVISLAQEIQTLVLLEQHNDLVAARLKERLNLLNTCALRVAATLFGHLCAGKRVGAHGQAVPEQLLGALVIMFACVVETDPEMAPTLTALNLMGNVTRMLANNLHIKTMAHLNQLHDTVTSPSSSSSSSSSSTTVSDPLPRTAQTIPSRYGLLFLLYLFKLIMQVCIQDALALDVTFACHNVRLSVIQLTMECLHSPRPSPHTLSLHYQVIVHSLNLLWRLLLVSSKGVGVSPLIVFEHLDDDHLSHLVANLTERLQEAISIHSIPLTSSDSGQARHGGHRRKEDICPNLLQVEYQAALLRLLGVLLNSAILYEAKPVSQRGEINPRIFLLLTERNISNLICSPHLMLQEAVYYYVSVACHYHLFRPALMFSQLTASQNQSQTQPSSMTYLHLPVAKTVLRTIQSSVMNTFTLSSAPSPQAATSHVPDAGGALDCLGALLGLGSSDGSSSSSRRSGSGGSSVAGTGSDDGQRAVERHKTMLCWKVELLLDEWHYFVMSQGLMLWQNTPSRCLSHAHVLLRYICLVYGTMSQLELLAPSQSDTQVEVDQLPSDKLLLASIWGVDLPSALKKVFTSSVISGFLEVVLRDLSYSGFSRDPADSHGATNPRRKYRSDQTRCSLFKSTSSVFKIILLLCRHEFILGDHYVLIESLLAVILPCVHEHDSNQTLPRVAQVSETTNSSHLSLQDSDDARNEFVYPELEQTLISFHKNLCSVCIELPSGQQPVARCPADHWLHELTVLHTQVKAVLWRSKNSH